LTFEIDSVLEKEFSSKKWDVTKLKKYTPAKGYSLPYVVHLGEIMQAIIY
jgi:hypothetical protein